MSDSPMSDAMHSPVRSHAQQIHASPSMLRAAPFHNEEVMRALMTTVGDLTTTVASHQAQSVVLLSQLVQQQLTVTAAAPRRHEFRGDSPRFDGSCRYKDRKICKGRGYKFFPATSPLSETRPHKAVGWNHPDGEK